MSRPARRPVRRLGGLAVVAVAVTSVIALRSIAARRHLGGAPPPRPAAVVSTAAATIPTTAPPAAASPVPMPPIAQPASWTPRSPAPPTRGSHRRRRDPAPIAEHRAVPDLPAAAAAAGDEPAVSVTTVPKRLEDVLGERR
jgi:hypothetical protein